MRSSLFRTFIETIRIRGYPRAKRKAQEGGPTVSPSSTLLHVRLPFPGGVGYGGVGWGEEGSEASCATSSSVGPEMGPMAGQRCNDLENESNSKWRFIVPRNKFRCRCPRCRYVVAWRQARGSFAPLPPLPVPPLLSSPANCSSA